MNGGEGWRVITCAAGAQDKTIINSVMLRFRPIAPKPVTDGSSSGSWKPENKNGGVTSVRTKRKYVRVKKSNEYYKRRRKKKSSDLERDGREDDSNEKLLTLQLLPEKTDLTQDSTIVKGSSSRDDRTVRKELVQECTDPSSLLNSRKQVTDDLCLLTFTDRTAAMAEKRTIETWVTVESVTDTCMDLVGGLGSTDEEKMNNLKKDTCPGFISDGRTKVEWVNEAYKKMVMVRPENNNRKYPPADEITVKLAIKEKLLPYLYNPAFTCWVRLQYTWQKEKFSQMVPCDVWKMESGGYAWKLDIKAALSLGL
ncbi:uncharacterized protein LOC110602025 [Manihot esculenta]|uniref:DUF7950 domain-containing protein n=1 Tax=Manihot esculenta TaxID=3983 RepID=A0A2C9UGD7_MANES|nr:uncharacterized protein LOC110602025 [Manihot esculenta]OAY29598.1 hypothetical protein MANES_15G157500v8 [Manihot esculenta]